MAAPHWDNPRTGREFKFKHVISRMRTGDRYNLRTGTVSERDTWTMPRTSATYLLKLRICIIYPPTGAYIPRPSGNHHQMLIEAKHTVRWGVHQCDLHIPLQPSFAHVLKLNLPLKCTLLHFRMLCYSYRPTHSNLCRLCLGDSGTLFNSILAINHSAFRRLPTVHRLVLTPFRWRL